MSPRGFVPVLDRSLPRDVQVMERIDARIFKGYLGTSGGSILFALKRSFRHLTDFAGRLANT